MSGRIDENLLAHRLHVEVELDMRSSPVGGGLRPRKGPSLNHRHTFASRARRVPAKRGRPAEHLAGTAYASACKRRSPSLRKAMLLGPQSMRTKLHYRAAAR